MHKVLLRGFVNSWWQTGADWLLRGKRRREFRNYSADACKCGKLT